MLSALGGWLDVNRYEGEWSDAFGNKRPVLWIHKAVMGRDMTVVEMAEGYLFPFGHRAQFLRISERRVDGPKVASGVHFARMHQKLYLVVTQPVLTFEPAAAANQRLGRKMPFKSVRILTEQTPELYSPVCVEQTDCTAGDEAGGAFWPMLAPKAPFQFGLVAIDPAGREIHFNAPLIWMNKEIETDPTRLGKVFREYRQKTWRESTMNGQTITYATSDRQPLLAFLANAEPEDLSNSTFVTSSIRFGVERPDGLDNGISHRFFPVVEGAKVNVAALERLSGKTVEENIRYADRYLAHGFDAAKNGQEIFANIADENFENYRTIDLPGYRHTWMQLVAPQIGGIGALSKSLGAVVDPNPRKFLEQALTNQIKIFGGLLLEELIDLTSSVGDKVPNIVIHQLFTQAVGDHERLYEGSVEDLKQLAAHPEAVIDALPEAEKYVDRLIELLKQGIDAIDDALSAAVPTGELVTLDWKPKIAARSANSPFVPHDDGETTTLEMHMALSAPSGSSLGPGYTVDGKLTNFAINILPKFELVTVHFRQLEFHARDGEKPHLSPDIRDIEFRGNLEFVLELVDVLSAAWGDFGKTPFVTADLEGAKVGFDYEIPSMSVGVINLSNINLATGLTIPFNGDPLRLKFNFSERHRPFILTVRGLRRRRLLHAHSRAARAGIAGSRL